MTIDREFWRAQRVLVTGHSGFKGAWLALWLAEMGAEVTGFALPPESTDSVFESCGLGGLVQSEFHDLLDPGAFDAVVARVQPTVVFHLAAQALVRRSYAYPVETIATNVVGTARVLEAVRNCGTVKSVVVVTSDKCYQNHCESVPFAETAPLGGSDPYSASKAAAEHVVAAYRCSYAIPPLASVRAGNVVGGGDWSEDRLVPDAIRALQNRQPIRVRYPDAIRPWQHVLEPLAGYLGIAERLAGGERRWQTAWNLGPPADRCVPVASVLAMIAEQWGGSYSECPGDVDGKKEARVLRLDSAKAESELGWRTQLSLAETIAWTVSWYRCRFDTRADMRAFTCGQIRAYEDAMVRFDAGKAGRS